MTHLGSLCVIHVFVYLVDIVLSDSTELIANQAVHPLRLGEAKETHRGQR